jgi:hypothetical protein
MAMDFYGRRIRDELRSQAFQNAKLLGRVRLDFLNLPPPILSFEPAASNRRRCRSSSLFVQASQKAPGMYSAPQPEGLANFSSRYNRDESHIMLRERVIGISLKTFLAERVQPGNPNDPFYNNSCPFCWDEYHGKHRAIRILPCNHVFGRECLPP